MTKKMKIILKGASLATALVLFTSPAFAQGPPPGPGGPMGGRPMVFGTVQSTDTSAGTITVQTPHGDTCTVHVSSDTNIRGQHTIAASDLKVGQHIIVRGVPTGISADSLTASDSQSDLMPGGPHFGGDHGGMPGGPGGMGGPGMGGQHDMMPSTASAMGTITGLHPLTVSLGNDVSVVVTLKSSAKVQKVAEESLGDIKAGDHVFAMGHPGDDGSIDARQVSVNMPMPMMGGPMMRGPMGPMMGGGPGMGGSGPQGPPPPGQGMPMPPPPGQ